jgi:hypothetical protein
MRQHFQPLPAVALSGLTLWLVFRFAFSGFFMLLMPWWLFVLLLALTFVAYSYLLKKARELFLAKVSKTQVAQTNPKNP